MISSPPTAAAMDVRPRRRNSGTAMRGKPVSMADIWSLMMSEVPLMSSLTGGEGRVEKQVEPWLNVNRKQSYTTHSYSARVLQVTWNLNWMMGF